MATRNTKPQDRLERIARLAGLPPDAVLPTTDTAAYSGIAVSTWSASAPPVILRRPFV
jgi:hypothetical protein